ncbi:MAG: SufD family Fe-S cluster assembly protein [Bacilli bacterium]|nr:SufD family Fe-S cluster assembly protein [Bacilli bacterium]
MKKYILNETPVRTSNNYKINDITLELDIPTINSFDNYKVEGIEYKEYDTNSFTSKIGLSFTKSHNLDIDVLESKDIFISYKTKDILVSTININLNKESISNIIIKLESYTNAFNSIKLVINGFISSKSKIILLNMIDNSSKSFIAIEKNLDDSSNVDINFIDLGGSIRVSNYYASVSNLARSSFNNIYIGNDEDRIDMNYYVKNQGIKSESYIDVRGALNGKSYKTFKGTVDFIEGSKKSIGKEKENTILLSNNAISRSLPMLLCHEEDVIGSHGVSSGKIDSEKLFYIMSRGITESEAKKLIIKSSFDEIINRITNEEIKEEVTNIIDSKI